MSIPSQDISATRPSLPLLDADNYDNFVYSHDTVVLFFRNDPLQFPESQDVQVILPELLKVFSNQLQGAVIDRSIERELQARFHFTTWPALVFLRRGEYLGVITGIKDWQEFGQEFARILALKPGHPPGFNLDKVCGGHA
ncbi:MAG: hydrogenase [Methylomonas sp.]|jgi:hydrogenase-1 operon protein HyaE|uniref:hydrogenase n=1 Tax=Methylomonas sp. TaxID=418 RepID=UPI0025DAF29E|nr:hydrogenase [Methylomonas sp.]MCK9607443.1 hydrogenase [Methylomonas sp.]